LTEGRFLGEKSIMEPHLLPDLLEPGLRIVFCGTAAGRRSAEAGAYYAKPGNRFWPTLAEIGLTPRRLAPQEFRDLPSFGLGLTDLAKNASGMDAEIGDGDYDVGGFTRRIVAAAPQVVAFNGKQAAARFLGMRTRAIQVGVQEVRIGCSLLFVLPSTSGAASGYWDIGPWRELARDAGMAPAGGRQGCPEAPCGSPAGASP